MCHGVLLISLTPDHGLVLGHLRGGKTNIVVTHTQIPDLFVYIFRSIPA